ncbi:sodium channel protein Nach [Bombyx mori]
MSKTTCKALVKDYCANCTFAGVHFIADDTKHWTERILWFVFVALSWYGSALLIVSAWESFVQSPISFGVETTYTDWDTKLPAVAICESANDDKIYNVSDTIWTPSHLLDLEDTLKEIAYFRGVSYSLVEVCHLTKNPDPNCPVSNYTNYVRLVRSDCPKIITNCSYNSKPFDCCNFFQPIDTDIGTCFIINSIQTKKPKPYPMISNMQEKYGKLSFVITIPSMMYTLGEDEVPTVTTLQSSTLKIQLGANYSRQLTIRNIENDPLIVDTTPEQRACRFHHENKDGLYPKYSYSACTVLCRKKGQLDTCGCNDHFMLGTKESERCNLSGIACLHSFASQLTTLKPHWANRPGLACSCVASCDETEITVIKDVVVSNKGKTNRKRAFVELVLAYLPTERFKRNVVRSRLDLVVSIGGTTGLFLGASILSFVELIFYFSVRFANNILMKIDQRKNNTITSKYDTINNHQEISTNASIYSQHLF